MLDLTIHKFADWGGNEIFILREDLLPVACGGNKVRIALKLIEDARRKGADTIIGYGNSRSNLCRVLAMVCAANKLRCIIISPSDDDGSRVETTNGSIVLLSGAEVISCSKRGPIAAVVEKTIEDVRSAGGVPYYVFGDKHGKGNEKVLLSAYEEVAGQIVAWEKEQRIEFNRIALAVGTGSTYAGLRVGFHGLGDPVHVTGFTIARDLSRCRAGIAAFTDMPSEISDVALNGGYGKTSREEQTFLRKILLEHALLMDPTYAGKALWGLSNYIGAGGVFGEKILFLHTGSLPLAIDGLMRSGHD